MYRYVTEKQMTAGSLENRQNRTHCLIRFLVEMVNCGGKMYKYKILLITFKALINPLCVCFSTFNFCCTVLLSSIYNV